MLYSALITVMVKAARRAGRNLKRDLGEIEHLQVSLKGPANFVTNADKRAEEMLYEDLAKPRPGYGFIGEDGGTREGADKTHTWIVDPLDGTTNFLHGIPQFAISIGFRRVGGAAGGLAFGAACRLDADWARNPAPWEVAAGEIIVREAGGTISDVGGKDDALKTGHVVCGNEFVHGELVKILGPLGK